MYALLSTIMHLLSSPIVKSDSIKPASEMIQVFQLLLQKKFGLGSMTFSVHAMSHLPDQVLKFGALWTHSTFSFESFYGHLTKFITGSKDEVSLVVKRFLRFHTTLSLKKVADTKRNDNFILKKKFS